MKATESIDAIESAILGFFSLVGRYVRTLWLAIVRPKLFRRVVRIDRHFWLISSPHLTVILTVLVTQGMFSIANNWERLLAGATEERWYRNIDRFYVFTIRPPDWETIVHVCFPVAFCLLAVGHFAGLLTKPKNRSGTRTAYYYGTSVGLFVAPLIGAVMLSLSDALLKLTGSDIIESMLFPLALCLVLSGVAFLVYRVVGATLKFHGTARKRRWFILALTTVCGVSILAPIFYAQLTSYYAPTRYIRAYLINKDTQYSPTVVMFRSKDTSAEMTLLLHNDGLRSFFLEESSANFYVLDRGLFDLSSVHDAAKVGPTTIKGVYESKLTSTGKAENDLIEIKPGEHAILTLTVNQKNRRGESNLETMLESKRTAEHDFGIQIRVRDEEGVPWVRAIRCR